MRLQILIIVLCTFLHEDFCAKVRYEQYQVHRITPKTQAEIETLKNLESDSNGLDFWSPIKGVENSVDIMVPPKLLNSFTKTLSLNKLASQLWIPDVQKIIDAQNTKSRAATLAENFDWLTYHSLDEINQFMRDLDQEYSQVELITVGQSYENREIFGVKVTFKPGNEERSVFIEANIHAREWITSAVATWILNQILIDDNARVREIVESHDWYIVPVFNPDGLEYTKEQDRLWRKTRQPYFFCEGLDANRNWGFHYNQGGTSNYPCSNTYRGYEAFCDNTTRAISEFINTIGPNLQAYISFHSYSQVLLLPYGHTPEHLDNYDELYSVGQKAMEVLAGRYGTNYTVGNIVEAMYVASGGSMDWVKGTYKTPITYTYELRDTGEHGFLLPEDQIIPCAEETFDSLLTILEEFDKLSTKV